MRLNFNTSNAVIPLFLVVHRLLREDEVKAIQWEAEEVKKERDTVSFQLRKKEWECDSLKVEWYD